MTATQSPMHLYLGPSTTQSALRFDFCLPLIVRFVRVRHADHDGSTH